MKKFKIFFTALALTLSTFAALAQNVTVNGTVKDAAGEPIVGANVVLQGSTTVYALTDFSGAFKISVPKNGSLEVSCMGYQSVVVPVNGKNTLAITLADDSQMIDETIVVAFGTSTKEAFTGSATVVNAESIQKVQGSDATRAIEGHVAGVQMTTSSGSLGSSPSIIIRGIGSISAGNSPLYVVDGIPYSGDMNNINPADIESITVLKDAASNSLYGSRGANGVIMVTTKKAKGGDAVVNVDAKWGLNTKALQDYDYITDPGQYYEAHYAALYNYYLLNGYDHSSAHLTAAGQVAGPVKQGGLGYNVYTVPEGQLLIGSNGKLNPEATLGNKVTYNGNEYLLLPDNWMKEAYTQSLRQEYNVNVSGTTGKASIYASFGYLNNKGIIRGADMYRYTARLKTDYQAKEWLRVGMNMGYTNFNWNNGNSSEGSAGSTGNIFAAAASIAPIYPLYIRDGEGNILTDSHGYTRYDYGNKANGGFTRSVMANANPVQSSIINVNNSEGNAFNGTGYAEVRFLKDFKFTFNAGAGIDETRSTSMNNMYYGQFATDNGLISKQHSRSFYLNLQQLLEYTKTFGDRHHFQALVGHENYYRNSVSLYADKSQMSSMSNLELDGAVVDGKSASSSKSHYNTEGYFARLQYDDNNTLFLSASFRYDASMRFASDKWWGAFWSVGAGWLINKERWFNAPWVDMLKLKASVGSQGNDGIGAYRYIDTFSISNGNDRVAILFGSKGNPDIKWETNTNVNAGVDFELFDRRVNGGFEFFYRKTADMLFYFPVAPSLGYGGYYANIGDMRNRGIELSLDVDVIRTKNFNWNINANATHYANKVLRLPEERKTTTVEGYKGFATGNKFVGEGLPYNTFKLPKYAGVNAEDGLPMWYVDQTDADGNVTGRTTTTAYSDATEYLCEDPTPKVYGGFGTDITWGGFDFTVQFTYSLGGKTYDSGYASLVGNPAGTPGNNFHKDVLQAWTVDNPNTSFPRFVYNDENINAASDRFLVPASYLNIQNAQIGYTLPQKWTKKVGVSRLRIYATCDNIWYWSYRKGLDPRYSFSGSTNNTVNSPVRTISGGINITF